MQGEHEPMAAWILALLEETEQGRGLGPPSNVPAIGEWSGPSPGVAVAAGARPLFRPADGKFSTATSRLAREPCISRAAWLAAITPGGQASAGRPGQARAGRAACPVLIPIMGIRGIISIGRQRNSLAPRCEGARLFLV